MKIGDLYLHKLDDRLVIITHIDEKITAGGNISMVTVRYFNFTGDYKTMMVDERELYHKQKSE